MPRVESSTLIHASRDKVIAVARENELFPEYMADLHSLTVKEHSDDGLRVVSDWVGIVPKFLVKIRWTEEDIWNLNEGTCAFRQITGDYQKFEGVWTFVSVGENETRFDSYLDYELEIPLVGNLIKAILKKTAQNNLDATLEAIKNRCESEPA